MRTVALSAFFSLLQLTSRTQGVPITNPHNHLPTVRYNPHGSPEGPVVAPFQVRDDAAPTTSAQRHTFPDSRSGIHHWKRSASGLMRKEDMMPANVPSVREREILKRGPGQLPIPVHRRKERLAKKAEAGRSGGKQQQGGGDGEEDPMVLGTLEGTDIKIRRPETMLELARRMEGGEGMVLGTLEGTDIKVRRPEAF